MCANISHLWLILNISHLAISRNWVWRDLGDQANRKLKNHDEVHDDDVSVDWERLEREHQFRREKGRSVGLRRHIHCQQILSGVVVKVMHCRADAPRWNPTCAILNFFSLKNWRDLDFYEQKFQETEKFHVRKVKCLVRATERKMSVWRMETSDDPYDDDTECKHNCETLSLHSPFCFTCNCIHSTCKLSWLYETFYRFKPVECMECKKNKHEVKGFRITLKVVLVS